MRYFVLERITVLKFKNINSMLIINSYKVSAVCEMLYVGVFIVVKSRARRQLNYMTAYVQVRHFLSMLHLAVLWEYIL